MGQEYKVIVDIETGNKVLLKEFMDYIKTKAKEQNITDITEDSFLFYHYR